MNKAWKWVLIGLGILVVAGLAFGITMLAIRGHNLNAAYGRGMMDSGAFGGRGGRFGGMMFGMGFMMIPRMLLGLGILVLAGFGVAHLVNRPQPYGMIAPAMIACKNCGRALVSDWKVCPHCGTAVQTQPPAAAAPVEKTEAAPKTKSKAKVKAD